MSVRVWNKTKQEATLVSGFGSWAEVTGKPFEKVDTALSNSSTNPVQNKAVTGSINTITAKLSNSADWLKSKNLFGGKIIQGDLSDGNIDYTSTTRATEVEYIPVNPNTKYSVSVSSDNWIVLNQIDEYNSSYSRIDYTLPSGTTHTFTTQANTNYIRVSFRKSNGSAFSYNLVKNFMVNEGDVLEYQPYSQSNVEMSHTLSDITQRLSTNTSNGFIIDNLYANGDVVGTRYVRVTLSTPLSAGSYTIKANVTSSDTDKTKCAMTLRDSAMSNIGGAFISRGSAETIVSSSSNIYAIDFYASETYEASANDNFSFKNIFIRDNSVKSNIELTDELSNLLKFVNGGKVTDFNTLKVSGLYEFDSTSTNFAQSGLSGNVLVIAVGSIVHQIVFVGNQYLYMRRFSNGSWNGWLKTVLS